MAIRVCCHCCADGQVSARGSGMLLDAGNLQVGGRWCDSPEAQLGRCKVWDGLPHFPTLVQAFCLNRLASRALCKVGLVLLQAFALSWHHGRACGVVPEVSRVAEAILLGEVETHARACTPHMQSWDFGPMQPTHDVTMRTTMGGAETKQSLDCLGAATRLGRPSRRSPLGAVLRHAPHRLLGLPCGRPGFPATPRNGGTRHTDTRCVEQRTRPQDLMIRSHPPNQ